MESSAAWREQKKCVTCHQVPFALWPAQEARARGLTVDAAAVDDLTAWSLEFCTTNKHPKTNDFTGGFLSTMDKMVLALDSVPASDRKATAYAFFVPLIVKY